VLPAKSMWRARGAWSRGQGPSGQVDDECWVSGGAGAGPAGGLGAEWHMGGVKGLTVFHPVAIAHRVHRRVHRRVHHPHSSYGSLSAARCTSTTGPRWELTSHNPGLVLRRHPDAEAELTDRRDVVPVPARYVEFRAFHHMLDGLVRIASVSLYGVTGVSNVERHSEHLYPGLQ
jgi:hypothetical protein